MELAQSMRNDQFLRTALWKSTERCSLFYQMLQVSNYSVSHWYMQPEFLKTMDFCVSGFHLMRIE